MGTTVSSPSLSEVLEWVAHLCDVEESALQYSWPPDLRDMMGADEWRERGQAARDDFARVTGGDPDGVAWQAGFASWESP